MQITDETLSARMMMADQAAEALTEAFLSTKELTPEATAINCKIIPFIMTYESIFSARIVNVWNSLPNSVVDACTVNAFKARLDKFWQHQSVKFHFTADLTGTGNRSEEVIK